MGNSARIAWLVFIIVVVFIFVSLKGSKDPILEEPLLDATGTTLEDQPMPPRSTMVGQPNAFKVMLPPTENSPQRMALAPTDVKEVKGCPMGLLYDVEMAHTSIQPEYDRHTMDIAAIREPQVSSDNKPLKIPKIIHMVQPFDQVPEGMREAIQTVIDSNPEFEHQYYSDKRGEEFIIQRYPEERYKKAIKSLLPTRMRGEFMTAAFLYEHGGVHLSAGFAAGKATLLNVLKADDEFVASTHPDGTISTEFIATTPKNKIIGKWLEKIMANLEAQEHGPIASAVTGNYVLKQAFEEVTGHKIDGESTRDYNSNHVHLLRYERKTKCLIGRIVDGNKILFYTRYPMYGRETRWYRIQADDADAAWSKRHVFGSEECYQGLTLGQENDAINEQPERNKVLVDMASYHAAKQVVGPKQKIPRIIMQTNKGDRIPKDLQKVMHSIIDMNPEYEHHFYSDHRIRDFIRQHFDQKTLDAFDAVIPGAYKADLFRYCWLYIKGGVFLDGDIQANRPLNELLRPDDEFVSAEDNGIGWLHNAFIACTPRHPIIKKALDMAVARITAREYGENPLSITGPIMFKGAFEAVVGENVAIKDYNNNVRLISYTRPGNCMIGKIEQDGKVVLWMRYPTYKSETRWYMAGKSYYDTMWHERRVFNYPDQEGMKPS